MLAVELATNKMIFGFVTRIGMHGAKVGLWTPILVIKLKIILFVDISDQNNRRPNSDEIE